MQNDTFLTVKIYIFVAVLKQITVYMHPNEVLLEQIYVHHYSTKLVWITPKQRDINLLVNCSSLTTLYKSACKYTSTHYVYICLNVNIVSNNEIRKMLTKVQQNLSHLFLNVLMWKGAELFPPTYNVSCALVWIAYLTVDW